MSQIKVNIFFRETFYDYLNNIHAIDKLIDDEELKIIQSKCDVEDGDVLVVPQILSFEESQYDYFFEIQTLQKRIFLYSKSISYSTSIDNFWKKKVTLFEPIN